MAFLNWPACVRRSFSDEFSEENDDPVAQKSLWTHQSGNWSPASRSDGDSDVSPITDESSRSPIKRCGLAVAAGIGIFLLVALLVYRIRQNPVAKDDVRKSEPLPGISLEPSNHALPGVPEAVPAVSAAPAGGESLPGSGFPPDDGHENPSVMFGLRIANMDYAQLTKHRNLLAAFNATVKQAIASVAGNGVGPDQITLGLSPGSVLVHCLISVPSAFVAGHVRSALVQSDRFKSDLSLNLEGVARVGAFEGISTGRVAVADMSAPVILGTTFAPSTMAPSISAIPGAPSSTSTKPPTTARPCIAVHEMCQLSAQCCAGRCTSIHRCAQPIKWD